MDLLHAVHIMFRAGSVGVNMEIHFYNHSMQWPADCIQMFSHNSKSAQHNGSRFQLGTLNAIYHQYIFCTRAIPTVFIPLTVLFTQIFD